MSADLEGRLSAVELQHKMDAVHTAKALVEGNERVSILEGRLDSVDEWGTTMSAKLAKLDKKVSSIDNVEKQMYIDDIENNFASRIDQLAEEVEDAAKQQRMLVRSNADLISKVEVLEAAMRGQQEFAMEIMTTCQKDQLERIQRVFTRMAGEAQSENREPDLIGRVIEAMNELGSEARFESVDRAFAEVKERLAELEASE